MSKRACGAIDNATTPTLWWDGLTLRFGWWEVVNARCGVAAPRVHSAFPKAMVQGRIHVTRDLEK